MLLHATAVFECCIGRFTVMHAIVERFFESSNLCVQDFLHFADIGLDFQFFQNTKDSRQRRIQLFIVIDKEGLKAAGEWHQLKPLFPSLEGKSVLDLGCGYGWHCKFAEEQGATKILGIDLSKKMIEEAQKRNSGNQIEYRISGLEEYDYPENEWDCVISNLALHYIEDIVEIFQKVYRTLKPGGIFLFNIEHPVFTAGVGQDWIYTDDGKPQYWAIDNYFITGERNTHFLGCDVVKQHHTLTQIIMGLLNNGFELKVVEEADFLEEFDPRYNEEGVSELDEQFERLPDGHEAKRSYYLGFRQAQSEARPNIVISLLKLN